MLGGKFRATFLQVSGGGPDKFNQDIVRDKREWSPVFMPCDLGSTYCRYLTHARNIAYTPLHIGHGGLLVILNLSPTATA